MATAQLELRVAALEAEIAQVKQQLEKLPNSQGNWLNDIVGAFDNDPIYEEAMRLGREYRESLRPQPRKKPTGRKTVNRRKR
ncbi:MAG TPA: hypothetical protein PLD20_11370 [Blastocatellia bacterium]|nr:hypothetical protein [Blastocatellia bacterium]HMV86278.1 hypothetical protein [Blastocatellia bacterium]HMX30270.1 hypothetical protein [Blastocatellia bacterium]HMY75099.1 hypothetical protein [Blastocatellia bacterium]HMZ18522.1 hypothetical protein [Blastocatellia bacterium]